MDTYLNLGDLALTGYFPKPNELVPTEPLALSRCSVCGLSQLGDLLPIETLYGPNYGYESHLNSGMSKHLKSLARNIETTEKLQKGDVVLDIASNDGTLLSGYQSSFLKLVGIDPLMNHLEDKYPPTTFKVAEFFSLKSFQKLDLPKARVITSCSMFYDLDDPKRFATDIASILDEDGLWVMEQSYFWSMIDSLGFDTICHEHLLYLRLTDIQNILNDAGLEIVDALLNDVNGGSIQVFIQLKDGPRKRRPYVDWLLQRELRLEMNWQEIYGDFASKVRNFKEDLLELIHGFKKSGWRIIALGASTKGNVLLQYCEMDKNLIECIGEINPKKFGRVTPATGIPIVREEEALSLRGDSLALLLPWHFENSIIRSLLEKSQNPSRFLVPLPNYPRIV